MNKKQEGEEKKFLVHKPTLQSRSRPPRIPRNGQNHGNLLAQRHQRPPLPDLRPKPLDRTARLRSASLSPDAANQLTLLSSSPSSQVFSESYVKLGSSDLP